MATQLKLLCAGAVLAVSGASVYRLVIRPLRASPTTR